MIATRCLELSLPATLPSVRTIRRKVADVAVVAGARQDVVDDLRLCVTEAATNAVVHAYEADVGTVDVSVEVAADELAVVVSDHGKGLTEFRHNGDIGWGLRIIEKLSLRYLISSAPQAGTEVRMIFPLQPRLQGSG